MKQEILRILKNSEGYVSGEIISSQLKVTRAAVWKAVSSLKSQGYNIVSMKHHGYKLMDYEDVYNEYEIRELLDKNDLLREVKLNYNKQIDSTNLAARRDVDTLEGISLYVADMQLAGRGRLGRNWYSEPHSGLWFSLILKPQTEAIRLANLTLFAGLCVQRALVKQTGLDIGIKWPNDLLVMPSGRKICGILTETVLEDMLVQAAIIGVGINVNNSTFANDIEESASSLKLASGNNFNRAKLLIDIVQELIGNYHEFEYGSLRNNEPTWLNSYKSACVTLGREVTVSDNRGQISEGIAEDLTADGDLVVLLADGSRKVCHSGEVSVRGLVGYI